MTKHLRIAAFVFAGMFAAALPQALASEGDQTTTVTFSGPVEIPGQVLSAGTYVFKLEDSSSDRNIVQVFNKDEDELYGTFLTIPDYRSEPADKPIVTFEEREAGSPEAVKAWFYPGDNYGHDFVYPKARAAALARANNKPVPAMPDELAANITNSTGTLQDPHVVEMKQAPLKAQLPTEELVEISEVFAVVAHPVAPPAPPMPTALPHTASPLPLIGMIGILALGTAFALHYRTLYPKRADR
jgi:hypothetical protein